jgi:hypothetical protein
MMESPSSTFSALDGLRARELYKYFKPPPGSKTQGEWAAAPDTTLTSFVQLVAWRLDCSRAIVSLIDDDTQYFVAESAKTTNLENPGANRKSVESELQDDETWVRVSEEKSPARTTLSAQ